MKISHDRIEISDSETILWKEVKTLRLINDKLALIMEDGRIVEIPHLRASTIDSAFRAYENFLMSHPKPGKNI